MRMNPSYPVGNGRRQRVAAILAVIWLSVFVTSASHSFSEAHRICSEHNQVEHTNHAGGENTSFLQEVIAPAKIPAQSGMDHAECEFVADRRNEGVLLAHAEIVIHKPFDVDPQQTFYRTTPVLSLTHFRVAPKNSPPSI